MRQAAVRDKPNWWTERAAPCELLRMRLEEEEEYEEEEEEEYEEEEGPDGHSITLD